MPAQRALAGAQVLSGQENIGDKNYEETCKRKQNRVHFLVVYWVKSFLAQSADSSAHSPICREQGRRAESKEEEGRLKKLDAGLPWRSHG